MVNKVTEIIPDDMPDWFYQDIKDGQLFKRLLERLKRDQSKDAGATNNWIEVTDRLPDFHYNNVLVAVTKKGYESQIHIAHRYEGKWVITYIKGDHCDFITHWQYLPDNPL